MNKQQVFEDDEDYIRFLNVLRRQTQPNVDAQGQTFQPRCHVYAYCLMGNHVHLLLKSHRRSILHSSKGDKRAVRYGSMVCESLPCDEEFETYIDDSEYEKYPEY